jgi:hypothetical protein
MLGMRSVVSVAAILACIAAAAAEPPPVLPDTFTPVLARFVGDQTGPVPGTDGYRHVVYELLLTNARAVPATLTRVSVLDGAHHERVVKTLEGPTLRAALHELNTRPAADLVLAPNASRLLFVELAFDAGTPVPDAILHRIEGTGAASPGATAAEPLSELVAWWDLTHTPPTPLGPPLAGEGWVAANGCCTDRGAHRGAVLPIDGRLRDAQRFAIDWMRVDTEGRMVHGDPARPESFLAYDQPILAVADGTVTEVLDGLDDQVPGTLPDPRTITIANVDGNHVVLDLGGGRWVFYAHMKKATIRVRTGDRVHREQELGRLGNTGNTSAPHLHLHVMDGPSALDADGMPWVLDAVTLTGQLDGARWYDPASRLDEAYRLLPAVGGAGPRRGELPMDLDVVTFPEAR